MKQKYFGWEFRKAIETAAHKVCADLALKPVTVSWRTGMATAGINSHGDIFLSHVRDDALLTHADLMKYTGYVVHELLHRKYTDFNARGDSQYINELCNALEDARIEHLAIKTQLTGNVTGLLTTLINRMVIEALVDVTDWADPAQYPFVLAVYTRNHSATKIPLADGLAPIFDEAVIRLAKCMDTTQTLALAKWVYDSLQCLPQPKGAPKPPKGPTKPSKDGGNGEGRGKGDRASDEAGDKGGKAGKATAPRGTTARPVEPTIDAGENGTGGYWIGSGMAKPLRHVGDSARYPITF